MGTTMAAKMSEEMKEELSARLRVCRSSLGGLVKDLWGKWCRGEISVWENEITLGSLSEGSVTVKEGLSAEIERYRDELARCKEDIDRKNAVIAELEASEVPPPERSVEEIEIEKMGASVGMSYEEMLKGFLGKLESGEIGLSPRGLEVGTVDACPFDWKMFTEACDEVGVVYDTALKKVLPMVYRV